MAIQLTKINIFVSGTSETDAERAALKAVAEELNCLLEKTKSITLGVLSWPDSIRPGVNDDPQKEINRQLMGQYDIYIGILGTRFGSPTPRAGSGTEEECGIAIEQFLKDTTSVRILFYFKKDVIDAYSIDLAQLEKVKHFRDRLSQIGVLYRDFKDTASFVDIVRDNLLNLIVDEWIPPSWIPIEIAEKTASLLSKEEEPEESREKCSATTDAAVVERLVGEAIEDDEQNDMGLFEILQEFYASIESLMTTLANLTKITADVGHKFEVHSKAISEQTEKNSSIAKIGGSRDMQKYIAEAQRLIDASAIDLDEYAKEMNPLLIDFKNNIGTILKTFESSYDIATKELQIPESKKKEDLQGLQSLLDTMEGVQGQISSFQQLIEGLPALTIKFKKARGNASRGLGELVAEIRLAFIRGQQIIDKLNTGNDGLDAARQ